MSEEENIQKQIIEKFSFLQDKVVVKRERRILIDVDLQNFWPVFDYLRETLGFNELSTITGLDEIQSFGIIYHIHRAGKIVVNLKTHTSHDNPKISSISKIFPAADQYERELMDLFGIEVEGLPEGHRYPLPDVWPKGDHPLRKDWKMSELLEVKNND